MAIWFGVLGVLVVLSLLFVPAGVGVMLRCCWVGGVTP